MAKSKAFFGLRRGSTKTLTFQVFRGQQITKDRVTKVSNPQTDDQGSQRMRLAMVANAASRLSGLVNHSFQSVEYGYKSIAEFRRLNLEKNGPCTIKSWIPKGIMDPGIATYAISRGTLNPFAVRVAHDGWMAVSGLGVFPTEDTTNSVDNMITQVLETGEFNEGDQLTFLAQFMRSPYTTLAYPYKGSYYKTACFVISRLVLKTGLTGAGEANEGWHVAQIDEKKSDYYGKYALTDGFFQIEGAGDQSKNYGSAFSNSGNVLCLKPTSVTAAGGSVLAAGTVILSRKSGETWQRSSQDLALQEDEQVLDAVLTASEAWPTYQKAEASSSKYLNQGNDTAINILGA